MPSQLKVHPCASCVVRLLRIADDRARDESDEPRLAGLYRVLAGEVWQGAGKLLWFQAPFYHEDTTSTAVKKLRKPNAQDELRKFLDSAYYRND